MVRASQYLFFSAYLICSLLAPSVFIWTVWHWRKTKPKLELPAWRGYAGLAAFGLAGLSLLLWIISIIWALAIAGFPYYSPTLLRFYRLGFYLGVAGIIACIPGKGNFRWPAFFICFMMVVVWVLTASGV
jgi:hypothetical protein